MKLAEAEGKRIEIPFLKEKCCDAAECILSRVHFVMNRNRSREIWRGMNKQLERDESRRRRREFSRDCTRGQYGE